MPDLPNCKEGNERNEKHDHASEELKRANAEQIACDARPVLLVDQALDDVFEHGKQDCKKSEDPRF